MFVQRKYFVFLRKLKKQHTYQPIQILQIFVTLSMECYVGWRKTKIKQKKPAPGKLWKKFSEVKPIKVVTFVWMVWKKPAGEIVLSKTAWLEFLHTDRHTNKYTEGSFFSLPVFMAAFETRARNFAWEINTIINWLTGLT